jgi:hypothetical protein
VPVTARFKTHQCAEILAANRGRKISARDQAIGVAPAQTKKRRFLAEAAFYSIMSS